MKQVIEHLTRQIAAMQEEIEQINGLADGDDAVALSYNQEASLRAAEVAKETYEEILALIRGEQAHEHLYTLRGALYAAGEPAEVEVSGRYAADDAREQEITNAHAEWPDYADSHVRVDVLAAGRPKLVLKDGKWTISGDIRSVSFSGFDNRDDLVGREVRTLKRCKQHGVYRKVPRVHGCPYCIEARATRIDTTMEGGR